MKFEQGKRYIWHSETEKLTIDITCLEVWSSSAHAMCYINNVIQNKPFWWQEFDAGQTVKLGLLDVVMTEATDPSDILKEML